MRNEAGGTVGKICIEALPSANKNSLSVIITFLSQVISGKIEEISVPEQVHS